VNSVDEYIAGFPPEVQPVLNQLRATIRAAAPRAQETISYQMPTFTLDGRSFIHFAGWKKHVSVYPVPDGDDDFERAIAPYRSGRSTVKFDLAKPIPYDLVTAIVGLLLARG
jgi:uncharacterized protein YdhG (YjbR/CyaY superfamily)